ncbi:MAG: efflux RND transporter periplasmic adaptor subunit [Syntrophobacteraceae bacterium]
MKFATSRTVKRAAILCVLLGVIGTLYFYLPNGSSRSSMLFRTAAVKKGDLKATISATGTVEPEELVDVGSQVAGRIVTFGKDQDGKLVDYGSAVEEGTVLALIDDALYQADVAQAKAQLGQANAGLERAKADIQQLQSKLRQAERDWNRAKKLGPSEALAQSAYDAALSGYEVAKANVEVGKAAIVQAKNAVYQAEASLGKFKQNLEYCTIKSPVKGIVIDRRVNIGQTVVASLNAPSLFLIAKDLRRLQVWVAVNEADIGSIRPAQPVVFTVDAFPGETFEGAVGKIRLNASMTQNVVTYTVEVTTDNSSGKLLPYLTANVKFIVSQRKDVLMVPTAALKWTPNPESIVQGSDKASRGIQSQHPGTSSQYGKEESVWGTLWIPEGSHVRPLSVRVGMSDGSQTEVEGDGLKEGMEVVVAEQVKGESAGPTAANPFTPKFPGRGRGAR